MELTAHSALMNLQLWMQEVVQPSLRIGHHLVKAQLCNNMELKPSFNVAGVDSEGDFYLVYRRRFLVGVGKSRPYVVTLEVN